MLSGSASPFVCAGLLLHYCRARQDASACAQAALAKSLQQEPPHAYLAHVAHVVTTLDALLAAVQAAARGQQQPAASAALAVPSGGGGRGRAGPGGSRRAAQAGHGGGSASAGCGGQGGGDVSWVPGVVARLKELLLQSDR